MKNLGRALRACVVAAVVAAGASALIGPAAAGGSGPRRIGATGAGQDYFDGTATETVSGSILRGTAAWSYTRSPFLSNLWHLDATVTYTVKGGTVTAQIADGLIDMSTGAFNAAGTVVGGTGKFAGATGSLHYNGVENLVTGAFTDEIGGTVDTP